ncbi:MAG: hypothetical protein ACOYOH_23645 [Paracraurococcus sp.]
MTSAGAAILLRGAERIATLAVAALCIWLGFRLFATLPLERAAEARLSLPAFSITLVHVGPGSIFALFGMAVRVVALRSPLRLGPGGPGADKAEQLVFAVPPAAQPQAAVHARADLALLNALAAGRAAALPEAELEGALHRARVALIAQVWQPHWPPAALARLEAGDPDAHPEIAALYRADDPRYRARRGGTA